MRERTLGLIACAACGAAAAQGSATTSDMSYTFAEGGYYRLDVDEADEGDGFFLGGSYAFGPNWFAFGQFQLLEFDDFDVDAEGWELGVGGYWPLSDGLDGVARVAYLDQSLEADGRGDVDDQGFLLSAGVRSRPADSLELEGALEYVNFDDGGDDTGIALDGRYFLSSQVAAGVRLGLSDNETAVRLYGRFSF